MIPLLLLFGCQNDNDKTEDLETAAILAVKDETTVQLGALAQAALDLQQNSPDLAGWTAGDTGDIEVSWRDARVAYERVEGAIAVLFPDLDAATAQAKELTALAQKVAAETAEPIKSGVSSALNKAA